MYNIERALAVISAAAALLFFFALRQGFGPVRCKYIRMALDSHNLENPVVRY